MKSLPPEQIAVAQLESLGLSLRVINLLERDLGIIWVEELLNYTPEQLKRGALGIGDSGVRQIIDCLYHLDRLQGRLDQLDRPFAPNLAATER